MTQKDVAEALEWSPSKVIRIETGAVGVSKTDLVALLHLYGIEDQEHIDQLVEVAKATRQLAWWDQYRHRHNQRLITFIGYEDSARSIRAFGALTIPGLLQTRAYATAMIASFDTPPDEAVAGVEIRMRRQELFDRPNPPQLSFILDEAVIRRWVGGPGVMREQLTRLSELNERPHITIRIARFDIGGYIGTKGSFGVLEIPLPDQGFEEYVIVREFAHGDELIVNEPEQASSYLETFFDLEAVAEPDSETDTILGEILATIPGGEQV
ncbi:hypothetical protein AOZ06_38860 [Kibdelosporangium phytohabitans]|uniref:HTH cro/C1-type domain-containing protein n=2 Tax=Kibdelosporangium phytohabitans TaxID=860235 RepID=A0A0N9I772_9PSEU|nr:hypothetical protein AOZ06_38860 [Kibdelosporangium phytohabitans]